MGLSSPKVTYTDLLIAGITEEDKRFELLDGDIYMVPGASYGHQASLFNLGSLLRPIAHRRKGHLLVAPFDVVLSEIDYVQPDLIYVRRGRKILTANALRGIPDLAVEVLSHPHEHRDRKLKHRRYEKRRVPEVWYVDPETREVEVLVLRDKRYQLTGRFRGKDRIISKVFGKLPFATEKIFEGITAYLED